MIKFDFTTYVDACIDQNTKKELMAKKEKIDKQLNESTMNGWMDRIDENLVWKIKETAAG